jgi:hypothetical protein
VANVATLRKPSGMCIYKAPFLIRILMQLQPVATTA